jgi:uncharacterized membrane protein
MTDSISSSTGAARPGGTGHTDTADGGLHVVLTAHRSLGPRGFVVLMTVFGLVSFVTGLAFLTQGAWPVMGFFGLDVALLFLAFKLNYRSGRLHELVDLTPDLLTITRVHPTGTRESFDFNPYWVRVALEEWPDGRTDLRLASHGREFSFARFLNDDERREFAGMLSEALVANRRRAPG